MLRQDGDLTRKVQRAALEKFWRGGVIGHAWTRETGNAEGAETRSVQQFGIVSSA